MTSQTLPSRLQNSTKLLVFVDCLQTDDFEFFDSRRRLDLHLIADMAPEQRLTNGRSRRDQALRRVRQTLPDIALIDLRLPDMRGEDLTRELTRDFPGTAVIILSTYLSEETVRGALQAGARWAPRFSS